MTTTSPAVLFKDISHTQLVKDAIALSGEPRLEAAVGARIVVSSDMNDMLVRADELIACRKIVTLDGPPGAGKTLLERLLVARARQLGALAARVQTAASPKGTTLSAGIHRGIAPGDRVPRTKGRIEDSLAKLLAYPTPALVIYDEAQNLGIDGVEDVRYYWERVPGKFTLVLSGTGVEDLLEGHEHLDSRVGPRFALTRLDLYASVQFAMALSPVLARTDPRILGLVHDLYTRGDLRCWNDYLTAVTHVLTKAGKTDLDKETAYKAFTQVVTRPEVRSRWTIR